MLEQDTSGMFHHETPRLQRIVVDLIKRPDFKG